MTINRLQELLAKGLMAGSYRKGWIRHLIAAVLVAAIALLGALVDLRKEPTNLAMLYLLGVFWFSVKMRGSVSPKGRRFRPSGGDFQGIGIYRSDMFLFGL